MYKAVLFDLDGTLLDTLDDLTDSVNAALKGCGLPIRTKEEVCAFVGNGIKKLIERAVGERRDCFDVAFEAFKRHYAEHCADKTQPYEGVLALLWGLKEAGVKIAVVSNKADFAVQALSRRYFGDLIDVAAGENESLGVCKKPAPDALFTALETLRVKKEEAVYVGDSDVDIQTANNAGIECISVAWGFRSEAFLKANGATKTVQTTEELSEILEKKTEKPLSQRIGNTPLVELKYLEKELGLKAKIFAKTEYVNAGGSIKDRVAAAILDEAEKSGKIKQGGAVVEATSGNTGIGLALVAAARGYRAVIVMPETMSVERRNLLQSYGAEIVLTEGSKGMRGAVEKALEIVENTPDCFLADQFNNPVCVSAHYQTTAVEIETQTDGKTDVFVAGVGTGGTLTGVGKYLKEKHKTVKVVAVEPSASPMLTKGVAGPHGIQGIGANFIPAILDVGIYDEVVTVTDEEAVEMAKLLRKKEGLFVGISSGANVAAAIRLAKRAENERKTIVTVLPDGGDRYLSTALFQ